MIGILYSIEDGYIEYFVDFLRFISTEMSFYIKKAKIILGLALFFLGFALVKTPNPVSAQVGVPEISAISIYKPLDISLFEPYTLSASINNLDTTQDATLFLETLNGNNQLPPWNYYSDGTADSDLIELPMSYESGITWANTAIYPDYIYPEIFFCSVRCHLVRHSARNSN